MQWKMWIAVAALALANGACDNSSPKKADASETTTNDKEATKGAEGDEKKPDAVAAPAADAPAEPPLIAKGPIAKINDTEISADEFNAEMKKLGRMVSRMPASAIDRFRDNTVERLIGQSLVAAELEKSGLNVDDAEIAKELETVQSQMGGPDGMKRFLTESGVSEDELKRDVRRSVLLKKYLHKNFDVAVDDAAVKKFYDENIKRFSQGEQVKASHILFKVAKDASDEDVAKAEKDAKDVLKLVKAKDADFAALAKEHSQGPSAPRGGDLGYFTKERMVPQFSSAAFKLKPGEISDLVRTDFGFHIIQVVDKKEASVTPLSEVKEQITANLENQSMRGAMDELLKKLREGAKIEKLDANIEKNPNFKGAPASPMGLPGMGGHPPIPAPKPAAKPAQTK